jgi:DMSO reductase family type II enzyme molybdopterin subunit
MATPTSSIHKAIPKTTRRGFIASSGGALISLKYGAISAAEGQGAYRRWEDIMRNKWTWDRVARGTHGTNCTGNCAFNVYVRNGIVWREEQQGEYGPSGADVPDYGPRGCNKGLRHAKYMYGKQRVLYPMKRAGERGEGKWERITWDQAANEIADKFIDYNVAHGPQSISTQLGTAMVLKRASFAALGRFATIAGTETPEAFAGVGDLPTGTYMTVGVPLISDTMAAIYKSKCCLVWFSNPAVTRIPDAHFFWEARYNGTEVISISPEFTPTAMHSSKWMNPKPGTDAALALSMVQVILEQGKHKADYIREQTDLPFLVRTDNGKYLRETDMVGGEGSRDNLFYVFDEVTGDVKAAPGTGGPPPPPGSMEPVHPHGSLQLDGLKPALEGSWMVNTASGPLEVTTVLTNVKASLADYTPEKAGEICGVNPAVIRQVASTFAAAETGMIFSGYRVCKWLHGDLIQRAFMLLLSVTGNFGKPGTGLQIWNVPKEDAQFAFMFADLPPTLRIATMARWDYQHADLKSFNAEVYGDEIAEEVDAAFQQSIQNGWHPDYSTVPWKMGLYFGSNAANWRSSGKRWREEAFNKLETIVVATPDMGVTGLYADYVLPVAHHYERQDFMLEPRTPYTQVLDAAVPPLGESKDDFAVYDTLAAAISRRATERAIAPIEDNFMGFMPVSRDLTQYHDKFTMGGKIKTNKDVAEFLLNLNEGIPEKSFDELARKGIVRNNDTDGVIYGEHSPYGSVMLRAWEKKTPYPTLTGRQQYYLDHDWFMEEGEQVPVYKAPIKIKKFPLQMLMGHARHGIHSMWRDDSLLLSLQRGEPDIYISAEDAKSRGVVDGDMIRVFNTAGEFFAIAHVSSGIQPGMTFMYHGWDPMMFKGKQNFGAVVSSAGLIKKTSLVSGYGHITYRPLAFEPNAVFGDFTCDFEKDATAA